MLLGLLYCVIHILWQTFVGVNWIYVWIYQREDLLYFGYSLYLDIMRGSDLQEIGFAALRILFISGYNLLIY